MKGLCNNLLSLIPDHHLSSPKELLSHHDQLEQAAGYIKLLRERVEELRKRKTQLLMNNDANKKLVNNITGESELPILKVRDLGPDLEVVLITGIRKNFMVHEIISIIGQEGAEVVGVNISNVGHKILHTLHAQVKVSRVGMDTSRIFERIQELIS